MRLPPLSVRARLTLWHAGVLTLIICIFSAGIFLFVGARLYAGLDTQLAREIGTISRVYREEPEELKDLAPLGDHIVPDRCGRQHPSSDRSVGARRTVTGPTDRQLRITALLDLVEWPSLSRSEHF